MASFFSIFFPVNTKVVKINAATNIKIPEIMKGRNSAVIGFIKATVPKIKLWLLAIK